MWEWREERGRWRLDDSGSWNWDEPSLLARVGSAPFGPGAARGSAAPPAPPVPPPVPPPPPGPWTPPGPWRRGPSLPPQAGPGHHDARAGGREIWEPRELGDLRDLWDERWPIDAELLPVEPLPGEPASAEGIPSEETPIFAAVAEDHERDEATGGQRLRPSRHGVPEPGHPGADDRREYRTAPWIPDPSPGSGPFAMPIARHARSEARSDARTDTGARADTGARSDGVDGRHALRR